MGVREWIEAVVMSALGSGVLLYAPITARYCVPVFSLSFFIRLARRTYISEVE